MVEVISNLERDWRQVFDDLRLVVYITFEPVEYQGRGADYLLHCIRDYKLITDRSGFYVTLFRT